MAKALGGVVAVMGVLVGTGARADDTAEKVELQRTAAKANWTLLETGDPALHETPHLIVCAPAALDKRLKEVGAGLEKPYAAAEKALQIKPKEELWPGKLTVYLLPEREHFTAFIRRVEKRRLVADEAGSHFVEGDLPHVAASTPRSKLDPSLEGLAGEQIAASLLQRKAGAKVPLPEWLLQGFGRATLWRTAAPTDKAVPAERKLAQALVSGKKRTARDIWNGGLDAEEAVPLRASLAEFLAYGPGHSKLPDLLAGFKPEENQDSRTMEQALSSAGIKPEVIEARWRDWVFRGGR